MNFYRHLGHNWERGREQHVVCGDCDVLLYHGGLPHSQEEKQNIVNFLVEGRRPPPRRIKRYRRNR